MLKRKALLDDLDKKIIQELQNNAHVSNVELAKRLFTSEHTMRNRIKRLLDKKILSITAIPDLEVFGFGFMSIVAFQITISNLSEAAERLAKYPNILFLANVTGRYDLIAVFTAKSSKEQSLFMEKLDNLPGLLRTETFVCIDIYKGCKGGFDFGQLIKENNLNLK